jgi:CHRD domain/IPTL-CTERM motif
MTQAQSTQRSFGFQRFSLFVASVLLSAAASAQLFSANLQPGNEVPPVTSTATGTALVGIIGGNVVWNLNVTNLNNVIAGHIHRGAVGVNGPVVVNFAPAFNPAGNARGSTAIDPVLASEISNNPAGFYVNIHTTQNPGGEIRGPLAITASTPYGAVLSGANEVPPADPNASGTANLLMGGGIVAYAITTNNVPGITAAHIHRGSTGTNGPVIVDFAPTFNGSVALGIVPSTPQTVIDIAANPQGHYVNVHTTAFPGGAVRGQVAAAATSAGVAAVPTLSQWTMIVLAMLLLAFGARQVGLVRR